MISIFNQFFIIEKKETDINKFVKFWEQIYNNINANIKFRDDKFYLENIGIKDRNLIPLKTENVKPLFLWKNGMELSKDKIEIVENVKQRIKELNDFRTIAKPTWEHFDDFYQSIALNCVKTKAPVFSLFIVHIAHPINYPIIDQNVIRAYNYLVKRFESEVKPRNYLKIYKDYIKFFNELVSKSNLTFRAIDKALWSFGRFLKNSGFDDLIKKVRNGN